MFYYYFIIALQVYCFYHIYKNRNPFYWYLIILFVPLIGSVIYILQYVYNKRDANKIQSEINTMENNMLNSKTMLNDISTIRQKLMNAKNTIKKSKDSVQLRQKLVKLAVEK